MKILITGICGFVGSTLARGLGEGREGAETIFGMDNLARPGSDRNRIVLREVGIRTVHGDLRCASDVDSLPDADWVIDAAANPSVLAGVDGRSTARQLVEHNLVGTLNVLEYCRRVGAGLILLSTSRVYSIPGLAGLPIRKEANRFVLGSDGHLPPGASTRGVSEEFSTTPPVSLYGTTKLASERLALEYGEAFSFPVWVNRCGVLAGAGQFGTAGQGVLSYWIHGWHERASLRYTGFDGQGMQVRDAFHPTDLARLVRCQMGSPSAAVPRVCNVGGGLDNSLSLAELSAWCAERFGPRDIGSDPGPRPFDIPWMVMDCARAERAWGWRPVRPIDAILEEIAAFADEHPHWLGVTGA
ncbi:MAG: NAD-dependent epimerase/dehydratase family protein [Candidatus Rokuibacteriota bacterium]